ncbi:nucleoside hydrolase [Aestuariibacter sp. A3R04]|uniref:nucleoside hydrolase n=1 Tax=Aestuariibacter sp. A3R04 TaxID=2841571 RepID=UPI001C0A0001|nr:nucleoside hydrolase [Aestuariibacter sp. A3R04]MBU3022676.1 nucleoside hydrolase [Aestuariibacter sp. A3R04]
MQKNNDRTAVIFDHDGGIDDLLSLVLLLSMDHVDVLGVTITPADCYPDDALLSTLKILSLTGNQSIPVAVGNKVGPNPFPPDWRAQPRVCHSMPAMLRVEETRGNVSALPADEWMVHFLKQSAVSVTVLMTGPCTNLAHALDACPSIAEKIDRVVWMGGAVDVKGNVAMHDHDGTAEWNAYWDPLATHQLISSGVSVLMVPLDATNALPVNRAFLTQLAKVGTEVSDLAGQFWAATVTAIPAYEFTYFLWDILATAVMGLPSSAITVTSGSIAVSVQTPNAGETYRAANGEGNTVQWVSSVDADLVRNYVISQFSRPFSAFTAENVS